MDPKSLNLKNARPLVIIQDKSLESMQWRSYVVSKDLLESQGYYQGCSKLWLPKQTLCSLSNPKPSHSLQAYPSKPIRKWKPKTSTSLKGPSYPYGRLNTIKIWIPKRPSDHENKVKVISNSINKTNKVGIKDMENGVSQPFTLTIKERAQQLQVLLFGKRSF